MKIVIPRTPEPFIPTLANCLLFVGAALVAVQPCSAGQARFVRAGSLTTPRVDQQAVLLADGKVLIAGGLDSQPRTIPRAELFDPATRTWIPTGSMNASRRAFTATLLDNGMVLAVGGGKYPPFSMTAELYDPAAGTWSATGNPVATKRVSATAILLPSGKVLLAGGSDGQNDLRSAELYDPGTGTWIATGDMVTARALHTATLLPSGDVLVIGGLSQVVVATNSSEIYHIATGQWTSAGSLAEGRFVHSATRLSDGTVLVAGGAFLDSQLNTIVLDSAELFHPDTNTWSITGSLNQGRAIHSTNLLRNGQAISVGGVGSDLSSLASAELYQPTTGTWAIAPAQLHNPRHGHSAVNLPDGSVLIAAGIDNTGGTNAYPAMAELYTDRR